MQDHEVLADGFERACFYAGYSTEPVKVIDYPEPEALTISGREEAMGKMREWIENAYSKPTNEIIVVG